MLQEGYQLPRMLAGRTLPPTPHSNTLTEASFERTEAEAIIQR